MRKIARLFATVVLVALGTVSAGGSQAEPTPPTHPSLVRAKLPPLIGAQAFFGQEDLGWNYKVSPDGSRLIWIERLGDRPALHVRPVAGGPAQVIAAEKPIYRAYWTWDSRHVVFYWDDEGDENYHMMVADTDAPDQAPRDVTPFDGARVWWHQSFPDDPAHMLVKINKRDPALYDFYRLNIRSGRLDLIAENPGDVINWVTDAQGEIIARFRRRDDGSWWLEAPESEPASWRTVIEGSFNEAYETKGHSKDGTSLWALSSLGRDKKAFVRLDLESGEEEVIYSHPEVDVEGAWIDPDTFAPLQAWSWPGYLQFHHFDQQLGRDLSLFETADPANVWVMSATRDTSLMTVRTRSDRRSSAFYLFDRSAGTKTLLAEAPINRHAAGFSVTEPISFTARDGLPLHGYLTIPSGTDGRNLPMVLRVHGGPWSRDRWAYSAHDQFLANRGYAVLRINYRGSTGYGRAFLERAHRQFARKMHDDLIDGVDWAIAKGIADPDKIAIFGYSYGGYASLVGLTFTPEVFAAGINIVGVSDLVRTLETFPPYWRQWLHRWRDYVGDPEDPEDRADMASRSPINFVERIARPLLMAQGANDVRVIRENSDRIAAAMEAAGLPFEYIVFDDEGHSFRKWRNNVLLARRIEAFLAEHLGGRAGGD